MIGIVPVLISSSQARTSGYAWSGRDTLPLAVGLPLLAAATADLGGVLDHHRLTRFVLRGGAVLAVLLWIASMGGFYFALRRYAVGSNGPVDFLLHPDWKPVTGLVAPLLVEALALATAYALVVRSARAPSVSQTAVPAPDPMGPTPPD